MKDHPLRVVITAVIHSAYDESDGNGFTFLIQRVKPILKVGLDGEFILLLIILPKNMKDYRKLNR